MKTIQQILQEEMSAALKEINNYTAYRISQVSMQLITLVEQNYELKKEDK